MINCSECGSSQRIGSLFCSACGVNILANDDPSTGILPAATAPSAFSTPLSEEAPKTAETEQMLLIIPSTSRTMSMLVREEVLIGRADPGHAFYPELDLTEESGIENGVSRLHASLQKTKRGVMLIDRGSTNGTLLNRHRLIPDTAYPLNDGDEVQFGKLIIQFYFKG